MPSKRPAATARVVVHEFHYHSGGELLGRCVIVLGGEQGGALTLWFTWAPGLTWTEARACAKRAKALYRWLRNPPRDTVLDEPPCGWVWASCRPL